MNPLANICSKDTNFAVFKLIWPVGEIITKESFLPETMKFQKALISRGIFCKNLRCNHDQQASSTRQIIVMLYQIWYHLYDLKNEKSSHGEASLNKAATLLKITLFHRCFSRFKNCGKVPNRAKHHLLRHENSKQGKHNYVP